MNFIKKYWDKLLILLSAIAAGAFFFTRFFSGQKKEEEFPQAQKLKLLEEKKQLEQDLSQVEKKEYSDSDIEKKFNK